MSSSTQRNLTLTEELERLEQSITLTLQEIDSNFSRAHRIVTTSILPVVEQYAEHSKDVWEGAKFWKQFFEASANVSLSGYEEMPNEDTTTTDHERTVTEDSTNMTQTSLDDEAASYQTPSSERLDLGHHHHPDESELDISSLTISPSHSTPRPQAYLKSSETPTAGGYPSAYREDETSRVGHEESTLPYDNNYNAPVTPGRHTSRFQPNTGGTPMSSPFIPPPTISRTTQLSTSKKTTQKSYQKPTDPVLHHVLDKTYRVQATPLSKGYKPTKFSVSTPKEKTTDLKYAYEDSPLSSPELEAPKLRSELFAYSRGGQSTPGTGRKARRSPQKRERTTPRPGVSVLTPAKPRLSLVGSKKTTTGGWESDDEDFDAYDPEDTAAALGFSPPKTMQFHIPQSRLMKTPAKEASKRIVSDLLATAGGTGTTSDDMTEDFYNRYRAGVDEDEHSPTVVRSGGRLEDDTF
ncbi:hypothetical protein EYB26_002982 [Talaromyces marneffei]|uniref:uncharacterized protein n=1 Tax=Talaromyces marneffei TaxID=37727 RepID=UPI0012A91440|nr:uncharacterized protein EYB26_002982 [Talaromyces marneffei]QGA15325.1 hypothetical protein EYB26_002982 [Talaromyces marneffei]